MRGRILSTAKTKPGGPRPRTAGNGMGIAAANDRRCQRPTLGVSQSWKMGHGTVALLARCRGNGRREDIPRLFGWPSLASIFA